MTRAAFKKTQLDHVIDIILEAGGDPDHVFHRIADFYPADNVQDYVNIDRNELDNMNLTKSTSTNPLTITHFMKKRILSLKGFWQCWGHNTTMDWTTLTLQNSEEYLVTDSDPVTTPTATTPPVGAMALVDVPAITSTVTTAMLAPTPTSRTDTFMKNKGGADDVKPLKEPKQWNTWQHTFLLIAHAYDFKDFTNISYVPDPVDTDACIVFELQKKFTFGILVTMIKESSALPIVHKYSDPNATHYSDAKLLYDDLVSQYTKGLTGSQRLEIIERELDELCLDTKWGKTCKSFLNMVDNCLKDHQGIALDPMQFPNPWYITCLNRTLEPHTTLYQYIVNHQLQATSIANHLGTTSATTTSYESHVETIWILSTTPTAKPFKKRIVARLCKPNFRKLGGKDMQDVRPIQEDVVIMQSHYMFGMDCITWI